MNKVVKRVIGLGAVAGMRATVAPAVASHFLSKSPSVSLAGSRLRFMQSPTTAIVTKVLNAAEIAGDKNPEGPNRTSLPQTLVRVASGALVGAVLFQANRESMTKGMLIGSVSALAATFASFYIRQYLDKLPHVKDQVVGGFEDILAIGSGVSLMKN